MRLPTLPDSGCSAISGICCGRRAKPRDARSGRISSSTAFRFANVRTYLAEGLCPAGTQRNLQYAAPNARFAPAIGTAEQLLLADAQTSGGLLIAVDESILPALIAGLGDRGVQVAAPIGSIVEVDLPGRIEVS